MIFDFTALFEMTQLLSSHRVLVFSDVILYQINLVAEECFVWVRIMVGAILCED